MQCITTFTTVCVGLLAGYRLSRADWAVSLTCCSLYVQVFSSKIGLAPYCEVAFYHKKAKLLMVTDAVVYIPEDPPEVAACLATSAQCLC